MSYLQSRCPSCKSEEATYVLDRGLKFLFRWLEQNNRYVCKTCNITWQKRKPDYLLKFQAGRSGHEREIHAEY